MDKLRYKNENMQRFEASKGEVAIDYFKELFSSTHQGNLHDLFEDFDQIITNIINKRLVREVTKEDAGKECSFLYKCSWS